MDIDVMGRQLRDLLAFKAAAEPVLAHMQEFMERQEDRAGRDDATKSRKVADPDKPLEHIAEVEASLDEAHAD